MIGIPESRRIEVSCALKTAKEAVTMLECLESTGIAFEGPKTFVGIVVLSHNKLRNAMRMLASCLQGIPDEE